jgi:hypothetical protein
LLEFEFKEIHMNKEIFTKIQSRLEARISRCELALSGIETTEDLKKLTIERALQLQQFCKQEESLMDKFVQSDLYHLIGMGQLTPPQMMKLTFLTRDWLAFRSTVKAIAMNLDKISQLPGLPAHSSYKLRTWDDITLSSDISVPAEGLSYAISGNLIQVLPSRLPEFLQFWSSKAKVQFFVENFEAKAKIGAEYGGIKWTVDHLGTYIGVIKQPNVQQLFEGCAQKDN